MSGQVEVDRQLALAKIESAKRMNVDRNALTAQSDGTTFRLAQLLSEIYGGQYCEGILGMSFWDWVEKTFRDDRGLHRKKDWARGLVHQYGAVSCHPALVDKLMSPQRPDQPSISFSSSYFSAKLYEADNWQAKARRQADEDIRKGDSSPEAFEARDDHARDLIDEWLLTSALRKTRNIREAIQHARGKKEGPDGTSEWPFVGGKLDPDVKATGETVLTTLCLLEDDGPSPDDLSFVQAYERLVGFSQDCIAAFEAVAETGELRQLTSIIEVFKAYEHPREGA